MANISEVYRKFTDLRDEAMEQAGAELRVDNEGFLIVWNNKEYHAETFESAQDMIFHMK